MVFAIGDSIVTTVQMIGGRSDEVTGTITGLRMSRKDPSRVTFYVVDASHAGYGQLTVEAEKAREAPPIG